MTTEATAREVEVRTVGELDQALTEFWPEVQHCPLQFDGMAEYHDVVFGLTWSGQLVFKLSVREARLLAFRTLAKELHFLLEPDELKEWFTTKIASGNGALQLGPSGEGHLSGLRPMLNQVLPDTPLFVWDPIAREQQRLAGARLTPTSGAGGGLTLVLPNAVRDGIAGAVPRRFKTLMAGF